MLHARDKTFLRSGVTETILEGCAVWSTKKVDMTLKEKF